MTVTVRWPDEAGQRLISLPELVYPARIVVTPDNRIRYANEDFASVMGMPIDTTIGRTVDEAFPAINPLTAAASNRIAAAFRSSLSTGKSSRFWALRHDLPQLDPATGQPMRRVWNMAVVPVITADGRPIGVDYQTQDITAYETALDELVELIEQAADGESVTLDVERLKLLTDALGDYRRGNESSSAENAQLLQALETRGVIEQAKGIVMAHYGGTPDEAFARLVDQSQRQNLKVHTVSSELISRTTQRTNHSAGGPGDDAAGLPPVAPVAPDDGPLWDTPADNVL